jgi:16S rRNA (uracil1498-N3)-methyltransferase
MSLRFYVNSPLSVSSLDLEGPEAHHIVHVSRLRPGDQLCLFNGDGREYPARVVKAGKRSVHLEVTAVHAIDRELSFELIAACPLPKGDRAQFLVEKLTELGVSRLIPLETEHSVVHPREAKIEKLERYVIEASKQCGRNVLMQIDPLTRWRHLTVRSNLPASRLIADPAGAPMASLAAGPCCFAVGPEGGFTKEELSLAKENGWNVVSLGGRILRIETAAIALGVRLGAS